MVIKANSNHIKDKQKMRRYVCPTSRLLHRVKLLHYLFHQPYSQATMKLPCEIVKEGASIPEWKPWQSEAIRITVWIGNKFLLDWVIRHLSLLTAHCLKYILTKTGVHSKTGSSHLTVISSLKSMLQRNIHRDI